VAVEVSKVFADGEIFKPPYFDSCLAESEILEIDEDPFTNNPKLFHAKADPYKPKSVEMYERYVQYRNTPEEPVVEEKPKKKARKKK
jgi:hypothetical protein